MKVKIVSVWLSIIICLFFLSGNTNAVIIFQDNFDSQGDWSPVQNPLYVGTNKCHQNCAGMPTGWHHYRVENSKCSTTTAGNNTVVLDNTNNLLSGPGKSITFWDESCTDDYGNSDGNVGIYLNQNYNEIYVRFYIKFQPGYKWRSVDSNAHKFGHIWYYDGTDSPYEFLGGQSPDNVPIFVPGLHIYNGDIYYYAAYRCEEAYKCNGSPRYSFDVGRDKDIVNLGAWETTLGDGKWHSFEYHLKMNTNDGGTFNADGIHRFWLDGVLKYECTNIPWSDNGSDQYPRRGWNTISFGGNNDNRWTTSDCSIDVTKCEQWYAIDDVVISTEYIGTFPTAPSNLQILGYE